MDDGLDVPPGTTADLLAFWVNGDAAAGNRLFTLLYQELRILARRQLRHHRGGTLDTTALVHEAYLKLIRGTRNTVRDRGHFLALASRVMRQILVDSLRRRGASKRGGDLSNTPFENVAVSSGKELEDFLALDEALEKLEALDPRLTRLVELRVFGGMSVEEAASVLAISPATVKRDWLKAKAFLYRQMRHSSP